MHRHLLITLCVLMLTTAFAEAAPRRSARIDEPSVVSVAGSWQFQLDPDCRGQADKWFDRDLHDNAQLPGSTETNAKGTAPEERTDQRLSRVHPYSGQAWFSRTVEIPQAWSGRRIMLFLERCHWQTTVWLDGREAGSRNSLCAPHVYDLSQLAPPGKHRLTVCVDNRVKVDIGPWGHSITDETQTNWNGITGKLELRAGAPVWIDGLNAYPDMARSSIRIDVMIGNQTSETVKGQVVLSCPAMLFRAKPQPASFEVPASGLQTVSIAAPLAQEVAVWDEFAPTLHEIRVAMTAASAQNTYTGELRQRTGLRQLETDGHRFRLNGRPLFLRGTLECCIFPLTGFPPTEAEPWQRIMRTARSYGLNHLRFHSWCPPESAFDAADREGIMLQVENPLWVGDGKTSAVRERAEFIRAEAERILTTYGNHPSFCFMSMGNELLLGSAGDQKFLEDLVMHLKQYDPRHLYTCTSAPYSPRKADDYFVSHQVNKSMIRGQGRIGALDTSTDFEWDSSLEQIDRPVVAHEIGQYAMYPDFAETAKYSGVLRARNFELFRERLEKNGMGDQARDFARASGQLMLRLYKDEIEAALRSRLLAGFQMLDLHDFPGQGTALVGILNPFWESKGITAPEQFKQFCGPTVPLLRLPKRVWRNEETLTAVAEMAHFGKTSLTKCRMHWALSTPDGKIVESGLLPCTSLPTGEITRIGEIQAPLTKVLHPQKLRLSISIKETAENHWDIWVYPQTRAAISPDVLVTRDWNDQTRAALRSGKRVLLAVDPEKLQNCTPGQFTTVFWCASMFKQTGTMGLLCNPAHPALALFPTDFHSDWQWFELAKGSAVFPLEATPASFRPIVQTIDDFHTNRKLGSVFEARAGVGQLLVCGMDIVNTESRPAAAQLRASLFQYVSSDRFQPQEELPFETLDKILQQKR